VEDLNVNCTIVSKQSDFQEQLQSNKFSFIFISSFLYDCAKKAIEFYKVDSDTKLVLLAEFDKSAIYSKNTMTISMPVHVLSIANLLNGVPEESVYNELAESRVDFIAPSARVLIVDDIKTNLKVAEGLMTPYRLKIDVCDNGKEAIELIQDEIYDIVFMDHMMPEMDGIEVTSKIRQIGEETCSDYLKNLTVIALTANAVTGMREMFLHNGFNDFLAKPIETLKLNEILGKWIPKEKQDLYTKDDSDTAAPTFEIEGIDVKTGIFMTGGNLEHYLQTLSLFLKDGTQRLGIIKNCWENQDLPLYVIHVHALKSALASIGAGETSQLAKMLELAGKNEDMLFLMKQTPLFLEKLETLLVNIRYVVSNNPADSAKPEGDMTFLKENVQVLRDALESMDMNAADCVITQLQAEKWDANTKSVIDAAAEHILMCDYDEALEELSKLL
jgi:CheY-like chemotaxis protein